MVEVGVQKITLENNQSVSEVLEQKELDRSKFGSIVEEIKELLAMFSCQRD